VPRFESVDDRGEQFDWMAGQVKQPVGVELVVGDGQVLKLEHGAMPRPPIGPQHVQHVRGTELGQVVPEQHDLWLSDPGNAHGRDSVGGLFDAEACVVEHGG